MPMSVRSNSKEAIDLYSVACPTERLPFPDNSFDTCGRHVRLMQLRRSSAGLTRNVPCVQNKWEAVALGTRQRFMGEDE